MDKNLTVEELLQLLGQAEIEKYALRKKAAELQSQVAGLQKQLEAPNPQDTKEAE